MSQGCSGSSFTIKNLLSPDKPSQHGPNDDQVCDDHEKKLAFQSAPDASSHKKGYSQADLDAAIDKIRSGKVSVGLVAAVYGIPISKLRYVVHKLGSDSTATQPKHNGDHCPCTSSHGATILDNKMRHEYLPTLDIESCSANATNDYLMAPAHSFVTGAMPIPPLIQCALPSTVPSVANFGDSLGMPFGAAAATLISTPGVMTEASPLLVIGTSDASVANSPGTSAMVSLSPKVKPLRLPLTRYNTRSISISSGDQASSSNQQFVSGDDIIDRDATKHGSTCRRYDKGTLVQAFLAVCEGRMSVRQASCFYGVPYTTLLGRVKRPNSYLEWL